MPDAKAKIARTHDIVLFGATGFTGELTAQYLAAHAPATTKVALAGRNKSKLEGVRDRLARSSPGAKDIPLLIADVNDPASLQAVAENTRVVITTVGPYIHYGEPLVAACAAAGTDYVDLTGEPEFVDLMYIRHHAEAEKTGARIIHSCGFDSIPHDLGAYFTVKHLPEGVPLKVEGFVQAGGRPSGGTFHSAMAAFSRVRSSTRSRRSAATASHRARARSTPPASARTRKPPSTRGRSRCRRSTRRSCFAPPARSSATAPTSPTATTSRSSTCRSRPASSAVSPRVFTLAQIPPARNFLLGRISPGDGPSEEQREKSWFKVTFVGEGGGKRVVTEVKGGDPGYGETSKMLAESALCLAHDDLPQTAGQTTTAAAMGDALLERLNAAGITFSVRD